MRVPPGVDDPNMVASFVVQKAIYKHEATHSSSMPPALTLCKQFGPKSGLILIQAVCRSDGILKEIFEKVNLKKTTANDKNHIIFSFFVE